MLKNKPRKGGTRARSMAVPAPAPMAVPPSILNGSESSESEILDYLHTCQICRKKFKRFSQKDACLEKHGFIQCLKCFVLVERNVPNWQSHMKAHIIPDTQHMSCPICDLLLGCSSFIRHVLDYHFNQQRSSVAKTGPVPAHDGSPPKTPPRPILKAKASGSSSTGKRVSISASVGFRLYEKPFYKPNKLLDKRSASSHLKENFGAGDAGTLLDWIRDE